MKRSLLLLFLNILILPSVVIAVSGTCSSHGGVACEIGSDSDGSPVCKDGWADSSELYSQVQECNNYKPYCTNSDIADLKSKYNLSEKHKSYTDKNIKLTELKQSYYKDLIELGQRNTLLPFFEAEKQTLLNDYSLKESILLNEINSLAQDYNYSLKLIDNECKELGKSEFEQRNRLFLEKISAIRVSDNIKDDVSPTKTEVIKVQDFENKNKPKVSIDGDLKSKKKETSKPESVKTVSTKEPQIILSTNPQPTSKIKWYQKIFNWFK